MEHVNRYLSFYVSCRYSMVWINWTRPLQFLFFHTDSDSRIRKKISSHCIVHTVQSRKWSEKCGIIADDKRPTPEVSNYSNCLWTRVCGIFSDNCQFPHSYVFQADRHRLSFAETTTTLPVGIPIHTLPTYVLFRENFSHKCLDLSKLFIIYLYSRFQVGIDYF